MAANLNPYSDWLEISGGGPKNHYELLGLPPFETDEAKIQSAFEKRYASVRIYEVGQYGEAALRILQELSEAYACLTHVDQKKEYDRDLRTRETVFDKTRDSATIVDQPTGSTKDARVDLPNDPARSTAERPAVADPDLSERSAAPKPSRSRKKPAIKRGLQRASALSTKDSQQASSPLGVPAARRLGDVASRPSKSALPSVRLRYWIMKTDQRIGELLGQPNSSLHRLVRKLLVVGVLCAAAAVVLGIGVVISLMGTEPTQTVADVSPPPPGPPVAPPPVRPPPPGPEGVTWKGHDGAVCAAVFSSDDHVVTSVGTDGTIYRWDSPAGDSSSVFKAPVQFRCAAFSSDGNLVATGEADGSVRVWNTATNAELHHFTGHTAAVDRVAFSRTGSEVLSGSSNGTVRLWGTRPGATNVKYAFSPSGNDAEQSLGVTAVAMSPGGQNVLAAGDDNTLRLWRKNSTEIPLFRLLDDPVCSMECVHGSDWEYVITGHQDGTVRVWDVATGRELVSLSGHTGKVGDLALSSSGRYLLTAADDRTVRLWDLSAGQSVQQYGPFETVVCAIAFSTDDRSFVSGADDGSLTITTFDAP